MDKDRIEEFEREEQENQNPFWDWFSDNKDWIKKEYKQQVDDIYVDEDETGLIEYAKEIYREERQNE